MKPIPIRISVKDQRNDCPLFSPRVTVARDTSSSSNGSGPGSRSAAEGILASPPRNANDAKSAFERLFKK